MLRNSIYLPAGEQSWLFRCISRPLSRLYAAWTTLRRCAYDLKLLSQTRLPGFCLSVGNISVGGTGKSPMVMALAQVILKHGGRPVILTRGYGSSLGRHGMAVLVGGKLKRIKYAEKVEFADEAMMQSQALNEVPVVIGAKRRNAAWWYLQHTTIQPTHWILEDGFQHRKIARDLDIVLLDASKPWGNGLLLPAGSLREPPTALRRADVILLTRYSEDSKLEVNAQLGKLHTKEMKASVFTVPFTSSLPCRCRLQQVDVSETISKGVPCLVVTGIAHPQNLLADLRALQVSVQDTYLVGDHQVFDKGLLLAKIAYVKAVVTTAKDYWRDPTIFDDLPIPVFLAQIQPQIPASSFTRLLNLPE